MVVAGRTRRPTCLCCAEAGAGMGPFSMRRATGVHQEIDDVFAADETPLAKGEVRSALLKADEVCTSVPSTTNEASTPLRSPLVTSVSPPLAHEPERMPSALLLWPSFTRKSLWLTVEKNWIPVLSICVATMICVLPQRKKG